MPKTTVLPKEKKPRQSKKKLSLSNWLATINLVLTTIIGIGIALYLNNRNEEFQKQLIDLENNAGLAHIQFIQKHARADGLLIITNDGPAFAKNLQISLCFINPGNSWGAVQDI
mgnify:FL=1